MTNEELKAIESLTQAVRNLTEVVERLGMTIKDKDFEFQVNEPHAHYPDKSVAEKCGSVGGN